MDIALSQVEIKTYIGAYLDRNDLSSCRLVNKEWSQSFDSFFWRHIEATKPTPPLPLGLFSKTCYIQSLKISDFTPPEIYSLRGLCNLQKLTVSYWEDDPSRTHYRKSLRGLPNFLRDQCATLTTLHLQEVATIKMGEFWKAVAVGCPVLRTLQVEEGAMSSKAMIEMWKAICETGVEDLFLKGIEPLDDGILDWLFQDEDGEDEDQEVTLSKIRKLGLMDMPAIDHLSLLEVMRLCPELTDIFFIAMEDIPCSPEYLVMLQEKVWPELDTFQSTYCGLSDSKLAEILGAMPRIKKLGLGSESWMGHLAFEALRQHEFGMNQIQELDLSDCSHITSGMIQTVLEEAPCLVDLRAGKLESQHVLKGRPWACASTLKELRVGLIISGENTCSNIDETTRAILERISALTRLQVLDTSYAIASALMPFSLQFGLELLAPLKMLEEVKFFLEPTWSREMLELDVEWMSRRWNKLREIGVWTEERKVVRSWEGLEVLLKRYGVEFCVNGYLLHEQPDDEEELKDEKEEEEDMETDADE